MGVRTAPGEAAVTCGEGSVEGALTVECGPGPVEGGNDCCECRCDDGWKVGGLLRGWKIGGGGCACTERSDGGIRCVSGFDDVVGAIVTGE